MQAAPRQILAENDAENIQQGHLWKYFASGPTEPGNSICRLVLNGIQYILLGITAWVQQSSGR